MNKKIGIQFFVLLFLQGIVVYTKAQQFPDFYFEHITTKDGLSNNDVKCVTQDKNGIIWIGTTNGLNRYDGYRFKKYYHSENDTNSLLGQQVNTIHCDKQNNLWLTYYIGVSCFNSATNTFIHFPVGSNNNRGLTKTEPQIFEDSKGIIWICNQDSAIYKVLPNFTLEKHLISKANYPYDNSLITGYKYMYEDRQHNLWAINGKRIYKLDAITKEPIKHYDIKADPSIISYEIIQDKYQDSIYWINGWGAAGLYKFNSSTEKFTTGIYKSSTVIANIKQGWIYNGKIWDLVLDYNYGLYMTDAAHKNQKLYSYEAGNPASLDADIYNQIFIDAGNNVWLCSGNGMYKINGEKKPFTIYPITTPNGIAYSKNEQHTPISYLETDSSILLSTAFSSSFNLSKNFTTQSYFTNYTSLLKKPISANASWTYNYYKKDNELFISIDTGLIVYNELTKYAQLFVPERSIINATGKKMSDNVSFRTIIPYNENEIMIRTAVNGIYRFNITKKVFSKHYITKLFDDAILPPRLHGLFKTSSGEIFVTAAAEGLYKYDYLLDTFVNIIPQNNKQYPLEKEVLTGIAEDENHKLWIATNGILVYNPTTNSIENKFTEDGKLYGITRICFDKIGNAWANSATGIWCWYKAKNKCLQFTNADGLVGNDFQSIVALQNNGNIIAGLQGAVAIFNPKAIEQNIYNAAAIISELSYGTKTVSFTLNNKTEKKIVLQAGNSSFTVNFLVLNYNRPDVTVYYYKLSPVMTEFKMQDRGEINFNGLPHGTYTLTVKGGDKSGNLFDETDTLIITIKPYWYQTLLFKFLLATVIVFSIYAFIKWRVSNIKKETHLKQQITETEIAALKAQMNPHFMFNCINSIDAFIQNNDKYNATLYLNKFAKLIRNVLDSSKQNTVFFTKDIETLKLYIELEELRHENKFTTQLNIDDELMKSDYIVPPLVIQPFVENAILHGLKNKDGNNGNLLINIKLNKNLIEYKIIDNGIGRKAAAGIAQNKQSSYGIQLSLDRIKLFNKEKEPSVKIIDLEENDIAKGTSVTVLLKNI